MDNEVFGTMEEGIASTLAWELAKIGPEHGGQLVDCAVMRTDQEAFDQRVFRARDGWALELVPGGLYMRRVGSQLWAVEALALFEYIGDDLPHTPQELAEANRIDRQNYREGMADLVRWHRESHRVDAEFDRVFALLEAS